MVRPFLLSDTAQRKTAARYRRGDSTGQIASDFGVSAETVARSLRRSGVVLDRQTRKRSPEQRAKMSAVLQRGYAMGHRKPHRKPLSPEHKAALCTAAKRASEDRARSMDGQKKQDSRFGHIEIYMRGRGWFPEHRLIVEKALGRRLQHHEIVHHINGDPSDNRNSNLLVCTQQYHAQLHARMSRLYQQEHFGSV